METVTEKLNQLQGKLIPLAERIREYVGISSGQQDNINKHVLISELVKIGEKITRVTEDYKKSSRQSQSMELSFNAKWGGRLNGRNR